MQEHSAVELLIITKNQQGDEKTMVFNNIMVRADFVDGQLVPLGFQTKPNGSYYNIGRIIQTNARPQGSLNKHIEWKCRLQKSEEVVTLMLDIKSDAWICGICDNWIWSVIMNVQERK